jgi:hypothetical protein
MPSVGKHPARKVVRHKVYGTPRSAYELKVAPRKGTPRAAAQAFLRGIARELRVGRDLKDLKFDKVIRSPLGTHVLFQQHYRGKKISGAWVKVDLDRDNRVYHFTNSAVPADVLAKAEKAAVGALLDKDAAVQRALTAVGASAAQVRGRASAELVNFPVARRVYRAWKVILPLSAPPHDWRIYVDARSGAVLHKEDMLKMVSARGLVFDPNPVVTLNDTRLKDSRPVPDSAYHEVELRDVPASGLLDGPHVSTAPTKNRVRARNGRFLFKRNTRAFKEVMVYFHIDRMQRYIQSLGFADVNRRPIPVDVAGLRDDNSFYSPANASLAFGTGGVDDAEDAEIILHEYGHSVQDAQVPGFGASDEAGAMGEGFGDYLAASFFADAKPASMRTCVGEWDATAYSPDEPPCLRRVDSTKRYPRDLVHEVHADGEIWSACLWQIRERLGRERADKLVLAHHFLIRRDIGFEGAAEALILADHQLNGGANEAAIREIFVRRGILPSAKRQRTGYDPFRRVNRPHP